MSSPRTAAFLLLPALLFVADATPAQSDVQLEGDALVRFEKSRGASHVGSDVRWYVPAAVFAVPSRSKNGHALFRHKGVGIVVEEGDAGLAEVRRRGGFAVVRGRVTTTPPDARRPGDPSHVVLVRSLSYRRQSRPKK